MAITRLLVSIVVSCIAVATLAVRINDGQVSLERATAQDTVSGSIDEKKYWECFERRLLSDIPVDASVFVDPGVVPLYEQRISELLLPDHQIVQHRRSAEYVVEASKRRICGFAFTPKVSEVGPR